MTERDQVQVESRAELRAWLESNCMRSEGIWLTMFKKHVHDKHVSWGEVVEEALCFGWIDSLPRKLDADRSMLLLSPRRPGSPWSRLNKQRVEKLLTAGKMTPQGLAVIERAKQEGTWTLYDEIEDLVIPDDLAAALEQDGTAARNFYAFSDSSKKGILWWFRSAKQPATRQTRITETSKPTHPKRRHSSANNAKFDQISNRRNVR